MRLHFVEGKDWAPLTYESSQGLILFQAMINGQPATVLLDNGADRTTLDVNFVRRLGVTLRPLSGQAVTGSAARLMMSGTGSVTFEAPSAFVITGPLVAIDLKPVSTALSRRVDAVLGRDMLDNFAIMIEPNRRKLSLVPSGGIAGGTSSMVVPLDGASIDAEINGKAVKLKIDLGFSGAVRLTDAAWKRVVPYGGPNFAGSQTTADGIERQTSALKADLLLGRLVARGIIVHSGYEPADAVDGILGQEFLSRGTFVVDVGKHQLLLVAQQRQSAGN